MLKLYTLFDKVAGVYASPSHFVNDGVAKRHFSELMSYDGYKNNKSDYELYCIGDFDTKTGFIDALDKLVLIAKGSDFIA